jgi:hypothetical protein
MLLPRRAVVEQLLAEYFAQDAGTVVVRVVGVLRISTTAGVLA